VLEAGISTKFDTPGRQRFHRGGDIRHFPAEHGMHLRFVIFQGRDAQPGAVEIEDDGEVILVDLFETKRLAVECLRHCAIARDDESAGLGAGGEARGHV
jgi:hypothetical protein